MTEVTEPSPMKRLSGAVMFSMPLPPEMAAWALGRIQMLEIVTKGLEEAVESGKRTVERLNRFIEKLRKTVEEQGVDVEELRKSIQSAERQVEATEAYTLKRVHTELAKKQRDDTMTELRRR